MKIVLHVAALVALAGAALGILTAQTSQAPMMGIVANTTALRYLAPGQYQSVVKMGRQAAGDSPPLTYAWSSATCAGTPDNVAKVAPTMAPAAGCWNAVFPASGVDVRWYGVGPAQTAAQNATLLQQAAAAAWASNAVFNTCAGNVVIPTTGSPFYTSIQGCLGTTYQLAAPVGAAAAIFYSMPSPSAVCPGAPNPSVNYVADSLRLDLNSLDAAGLRIEGPWNSTVSSLYVSNTGTGSFSYNDCVAAASYPDAALAIKGITTISGTYYVKVLSVQLLQPNVAGPGGAGATGGDGAWVGTSGAGIHTRPNTLEIRNGRISGFAIGVDAFAVGDLTLDNVDLSDNTIDAQIGGPTGAGGVAPRPRLTKVYMENSSIGIYLTGGVSSDVSLGPVSSVSGNAAPIVSDIGPAEAAVGATTNDSQPNLFASSQIFVMNNRDGSFIIEGVGGGGGGGGAQASTATTNASLGGGGGGAAYAKAFCIDPLGINGGGLQMTIGAGGAGGVGGGAAAAAGGDTIITGLSLTTDWQPNTFYRAPPQNPAYVKPASGNPGGFVFAALAPGTSGTAAPVWPQTIGQKVTGSGGITWQNIGPNDWTASTAIVINGAPTASSGVPVETMIQPSVNNPGGYVYRAIHGTTTAATPPSFNQTVLGLTQEGTGPAAVWWQNAGQPLAITIKGGFQGTAGPVPTATSASGGSAAPTGGAINGCTKLVAPGGGLASGVFNTGTMGLAGAGGSTPWGTGGAGAAYNSGTLRQQAGANGVGYGAGGSGAVSAASAAGTAQTGGTGAGGAVIVTPRGKGVPW